MTFQEVRDQVKAFDKDWAFGQARRVLKPLVEEVSQALDNKERDRMDLGGVSVARPAVGACTYKDE